VTLPTDKQILITREFDAPKRLVYKAWTTPELVKRWWHANRGEVTLVEIDLRVGGKWRYVWRKDDGVEMAMGGSFREVVPPERIVSTESWGPEWPETLNTITFTEARGRTTITLRVLYPTKDARDAALKTGMKEGMDASFARFDELLGRLA